MMPYALGQVTSGVQVGSRAARDPILARASLEAAEILTVSARRSKGARPGFILHEVGKKYGEKVRRAYKAKLLPSGATDQEVYDALRLAIADHYVEIGMRFLQSKMAQKYGKRFTPAALGDEGRDIGCAVGGGVTALLGGIVGMYTGGIGTPLVGAGGTLAMNAAGCNAGQQAAQGALAAAQAAAAAEALEAARIAAEEADRRAAEQKKKMITIAAIGGGAILLLGVGYMIVK